MKNNRYHDDYDFETFYADVNGTKYDDFTFICPLETCYDTYTGREEDWYYNNWN